MPLIPYPDGITQSHCELFYSFVIGEDDTKYFFNESDPVCNLWLAYATEHGRYPRLDDVVLQTNGTILYLFADGSVIAETGDDVAYL